jgi:micrococcal nuclease
MATPSRCSTTAKPRRCASGRWTAPRSGQAFGRRAKRVTSELAYGKLVQAYVVKDTDRYGRAVAEVILPDGRSLNREMVWAGAAW